jgi:hypothetical protein
LVQSWQGFEGFVAALATGVLAALAGGVLGLPLVLLAARTWPRLGGSRRRYERHADGGWRGHTRWPL